MQFFVLLSAGQTLQRLHSWRDLYSWRTILCLFGFAVLSLIPLLLRPVLPAAGVSEDHAESPLQDDVGGMSLLPVTLAPPPRRNVERDG